MRSIGSDSLERNFIISNFQGSVPFLDAKSLYLTANLNFPLSSEVFTIKEVLNS